MVDRIVLAYSGGLATSAAIPWLAERYAAEIVAVTLDLGQGKELEAIRDRALAAGAVRAHVLDVREEFARDYVLPALKADALYDERHPMGRALGRPLIARKLIEIAALEQAVAIAHGCTGKGTDPVRLEIEAHALHPSIPVLAPVRDWGMTGSEAIEYARARGIAVPATETFQNSFSTDANLWGRSIERRELEDPWREPSEDIYSLTRAARECPQEPAYVELTFEEGVPTATNGVTMPLVDLVESLGTIAGTHGVGRVDIPETRLGITSREVYEAPAAVVLHTAHKELQRLVTTKDAERFSTVVSVQYADLVYNGLWFTPLREALDAFVSKVQTRVTGVIRLKLFKGDCRVVGRKSPYALYDQALARYDAPGAFDDALTDGLIKIVGLPARTAVRTRNES
jgi:argininosuccinate synthase